MIGLAISFDLGRYHATAWGSHVNEATLEWPPSPWRLLRALDSAGLSNMRLAGVRRDLDRVLSQLALASPPHFELPATGSGHTRHYVPLNEYKPARPKSTSLLVDAFNVLDPHAELRAWWGIHSDSSGRAALAAAAAAVGYLGRSESVCSMRLLDADERPAPNAMPAADVAHDELWSNAERVDLLDVAVDVEDPLSVLRVSVTDLRRRRTLTPPGTCRVSYAVLPPAPPDLPAATAASAGYPTLAHIRIAGAARPAETAAVTVGHGLRKALQRVFDHDGTGARSPVLSGHDEHGPRRDQHAHAHYLSLPGSDRRVASLVVWAPEGLGPSEVGAIAELRQLRMRDAESFRVALVGLGTPAEMSLPALLGPAEVWRSVTPLALTRHPKRRGGRMVDTPTDQIQRELELRGLPRAREVEMVPGSWMRFTRTRPGVSQREAALVVGVELRFDEPLLGPLCLGGLSHFGLGLFEPHG